MARQAIDSAAAVADRQMGWVYRLPSALRDYALLARWDRPIGTWLLLLPCWWGLALGGTLPSPWLMLLFAVGAFAMRGAGCTVNDLADRDFDRRVERTRNRPLAAGRVRPWQAVAFVLAQCLVGLAVLLWLPPVAVAVAFASVPLVVAYPFMKRITYWPQAFLGLTFNWGALVGYAAAEGALALPAFLLYAAGFFWTMGYDTIYAHQDKADDVLVGVKSTALKLGAATPRWLWGFYGASLALLVAAAVAAGSGPGFFLLLPLVVWTLARQIVGIDLDSTEGCLARFRSNRLAGLAVFAALLAGHWMPW
ncbi:4-hydroxybenzoate octaprenyltransferase [Geminicoccaceae bacterium 1502E]|nr:4-hydroxybenzoate octaprenyltransferase [Geminicoccaceae bacterium 1502E]